MTNSAGLVLFSAVSGGTALLLLFFLLRLILQHRTLKQREQRRSRESEIFERKEMEQRLRTLSIAVEQSANTIVITDTTGSITFANKAFERTTGYTVDEALGKNPSILKSGTQTPGAYDSLWETISAGGVWRGEFLNKRKDGTTYWEEAVITPVRDAENKIIAYLAVKEDITRRKNAEKAMIRAKQEAENANRLKSEFLANMSHEIRTPMNAIIGFTDLLLDAEEDGKKRDQLNIIKKSGSNLLNLINDILDFSRIEAGKVRIEKNNFNLHRSLRHIKALYEMAAEEKGLDFSLTIGKEVPELVKGDELRLNQILLNIVSNSFKFTDSGSIHISCTYKQPLLSVSVSDTGIGIPSEKLKQIFSAFEQADSTMERQFGGTGLGLAISQRLASLMSGRITVQSAVGKGSTFTVDIEIAEAAGPYGAIQPVSGTLPAGDPAEIGQFYGEAMVSRWIGNIEDEDIRKIVADGISELPNKLEKLKDAVSRERNQDIRFIAHDLKGFAGNLNMPEILEYARKINQEIDEPDPSFTKIRYVLAELEKIITSIPKKYISPPETQRRVAGKGKTGFKILLAEDNDVNQRLVRKFLQNIGLECDVAVNGRQAVEMLEKEAYDLLLLDIQMPVMGGEETIGYIRKSEKLKNLYVIALTAHAMKGDAQRYISLGCDDYLSKPIDRRLLYEKINKQFIAKRFSEKRGELAAAGTSEAAGTGKRLNSEDVRKIGKLVEHLKSNMQIFNPEKVIRAAEELGIVGNHPAADSAKLKLLEAAETFDDRAVAEVIQELTMLIAGGERDGKH